MESQAQACGVLKYTKICRHWRSGSCFRGSSCDFAHSDLELREAPNLVKTQLCFRFNSKGRCNKGSFCRFAHGLDELQHVAAAPNGRLNEEPMKVRLPELPLRPPPGLEHLKPLSLLDLETLSCVSTSESTPREEPSGKEADRAGWGGLRLAFHLLREPKLKRF
ncbi:unnamed protein product [Durusdinium trenchii]|uniref:C3H1-type domain-containing protein n=1 Tax=Durusdinium trenchii TaxID=1381693 RepID=A0ABP0I0S4_9DINO